MKKITLFILVACLYVSCQKNGKDKYTDPWAGYRKAYELLSVNRDSAFMHFNRLAEGTNDKQQAGLAYYNMALIQTDAGDYYGAQESLTLSLHSFDERKSADQGYLAADFNELALTSYNLQDYAGALDYADKARALTTDKAVLEHVYISRGNALLKLKRYNEAVKSYQDAISITGKTGSVYARALTHISTTLWLRNPGFNAAKDLHAALNIHKTEQDLWGQNSVYAHLADFYASARPDSALYFAKQMLVTAQTLKSGDDELEAIQKLSKLSPPIAIRSYFIRYQELNDSLFAARRAAKNQFAVIRYSVEKNKADNLRLQKENIKKQGQLIGASLLLVVFIAGGYFWYRRKRILNRLETEKKVANTKLQLSKKVHDVVANGIYLVMDEVEYNEKMTRDELLDRLEIMYEQSRDIAHESKDSSSLPFNEELARLLNAFKNPKVRLALNGIEELPWEVVSDEIKAELKPVLLEMLVNMRKHSQASQVLLSFAMEKEKLQVSYRDNGVGMANGNPAGMGIQNTVSRIQTLDGDVTFVNNAANGLEIVLTVPLK